MMDGRFPTAPEATGIRAKVGSPTRSPRRKSWREKMQGGGPSAPHITILPRPFCGAPAGGKLFIASPVLVDAYMRSVPRGETRSLEAMRRDLVAAHGADVTCPTSTSLFARIAAEAALEDIAAGTPTESVTLFWRVIDPDSPVAGRLSCGRDGVSRLKAVDSG